MIIGRIKCRLCDSGNITDVWDFGLSPLANAFRENRDEKQPEFPLVYFKCNDCHGLQLRYEIDPEILFKDYSYESPPNLIPHFKELAVTTTKFLGIQKDQRIIDIGSNNGLLLREFKNLGYNKCVGFEPCEKIAQKARDIGVGTLCQFFNGGSAEEFALQYKKAELITCTNCFAHIPDLDEFVEGVRMVLADNGCFIFENAYLLNTLWNNDFGQAYFEHIYLHNITSLKRFFEKHGMDLFCVQYRDVQMGSVRGYVKWKDNLDFSTDDSVMIAIERERDFGMTDRTIYQNFIEKIESKKDILIKKLDQIVGRGGSIAVYAWPAKMTLINKYFGLEKYISYVVEESGLKTGRFAPGTSLEIKDLDYFKANPTDSCLIGAYNFASDIKRKNEWYQGEWINPLS